MSLLSPIMRPAAVFWTALYIGLIVLVNWLFTVVPLVEMGAGDKWPPVALIVGLVFVARDFAHLVIDYVPDTLLVESKSLKLYLASFRNHGAFHEDCTVAIAKRLGDLLAPRWLRIGGYWFPRGGMPIDIFYQTGPVPKDLWVPDHGVTPYRGRG